MNVFLRTLTALIFGAGLLISLAGCDSTEEEDAVIRVVHAGTGTPSIDFFIDFDLFSRSLPFRSASPYTQWKTGLRRLEARTLKDNQDVSVFRDVILSEAQSYTILVTGTQDASSLVLIEDDRTPPGSQARIRVANASTNPIGFLLTGEGGETIVNEAGFGFGSVSLNTTATAGTANFVVTNGNTSINSGEIVLETGRRYLIVYTTATVFTVIDG